MLIGAILNILNSVIANSSLLESSSESSTFAPSGEVIRQQNEIRHMMDAAQLDYERTKSEIGEVFKCSFLYATKKVTIERKDEKTV